MVNGISKKYRVKVISKFDFSNIEHDFTDLKAANIFALKSMLFDMATIGELMDMVTITEVEVKEN